MKLKIKRKMTYEELVKKYDTKGSELSLILGYFRIELFLTNLLLNTNISANQVTIFSCILGVLGCIFFSLARYNFMYLGAFLFIMWAFLDYIDGNIARAKNMTSMTGRYLDLMNMHVIGIFTLVSIGIALNNLPSDQGQSLLLKLFPDFLVFDPLVISLVGGLAYAMKQFLKDHFSLYVLIPSNIKISEMTIKRNNMMGKFYYLLSGIFDFVRLYTVLIMISLLLNKLYIYIYVFSIAYILDTIRQTIYISKKLYLFSRS